MRKWFSLMDLLAFACAGGAAAGCGATGGGALNPTNASSDVSAWASPLLGPSYQVHAARPFVWSNDKWWDITAHFPSTLQFAFYHASQVDRYATAVDSNALLVLHDVPAWLDPQHAVPPDQDAGLTFRSQSATGLRTYSNPTAPFFESIVIVVPPSTWIVVDDPPRTERLLLALDRRRDVPSVPLHPGVLAESFTRDVEGGVHRFLPSWIPLSDHETGGGTMVYAPRPDGTVPSVMKLVYDDAGTASEAARDLRSLWQNGTLRAVQPPDPFLENISGIVLEGETLLLQSYVDSHQGRKLLNDEAF